MERERERERTVFVLEGVKDDPLPRLGADFGDRRRKRGGPGREPLVLPSAVEEPSDGSEQDGADDEDDVG